MAKSQQSAADIRKSAEQFMQVNFPQIVAHGGHAEVEDVDIEQSHISLNLSGACSGCGISPMTVQALKNRLPKEIPEIATVAVTIDDENDTEPGFDGPF